MVDFKFLQSAGWRIPKWVISAPRRARRPDVAHGSEPVCPFCPGSEKAEEEEVYRIEGSKETQETSFAGTQGTGGEKRAIGDTGDKGEGNSPSGSSGSSDPSVSSDWLVRVLKNKFPFAPIHEVIIHSPSHDKNFDELSLDQVQRILETYRHQYNEYAHKGQVYIFHNRGEAGGESLPHPHSQLAVVPFSVRLDIPRLESSVVGSQLSVISSQSVGQSVGQTEKRKTGKQEAENRKPKTDDRVFGVDTKYFSIFCPGSSQWPDEVWVAPKKRGRAFGEITDAEIVDLAHVLQRLIQIFDLRHGNNFSFNFYIYPGGDWYLRLIPRLKVLGGFEVGTGIFVNTQKPEETIAFIKEHFDVPVGVVDQEKIKQQHQAEYERVV